jgi:adenosylcobyric acid synthase
MIQGTMSNAGKSLLTAGILRVLKQDGYLAAPFKSQNMALNSFVTAEGLEMGRAQVMQAEAAGIAPQVCMNPILLKPTSDVGSQVIVNGEVMGDYSARDYFKLKKSLVPHIMNAYHKLEEQADIIVIEGAGSPAEINLKADDIVNMGMAKLVDAPVLLVGDIDRGGVFAQLLGTVLLLEAEERARIRGFVINKFRGDARLLEPGPSMLYEKCGIPTLGVMPYLDLQIDDEDSLSEQLVYRGKKNLLEHSNASGQICITVIRLPHISNFTDFNPLLRLSIVNLQYADRPEQLEQEAGRSETARLDLIILPGTKNTIQDMRWLRESGMEAAILRQSAKGSRIMGICGGYQMLGQRICDPHGVEGGGTIDGMGLLPVTAVLQEKKQRSRIFGRVCGNQTAGGQAQQSRQTFADAVEKEPWQSLYHTTVSGYEIHMGKSVCEKMQPGEPGMPFCILEDGREDGWIQGRVLGTYLHGIFEETEFARNMIELLCSERQIDCDNLTVPSYREYKETQYDLLADAVRENLDMDRIYDVIMRKEP